MITIDGHLFGDLTQVQAWLRWNDTGEDWVIHVTGTNDVKGTSWTHGHKGQVFAFVGPGVLDGGGNKSWGVSWQSPADAVFKDITVQGFTRGGIVVNQGNVRCAGVIFRDIGTVSGRTLNHAKHGLAGLMVSARGTAVAQGCAFHNIVNTAPCLVKPRKCPAIVHGVYVQGGEAKVSGCTFTSVSGDPIRVRADGKVAVENVTASKAGVNALVSGWGPDPGTVKWLGVVVPGTLFNGKRSVRKWRI